MSDELKAAMERLRRCVSIKSAAWTMSPQGVEDVATLADACLAEHPADEDEPADIDWLCESGAKWSTDGTALVIKGDAGPEIVCSVNRRSGEDYIGGLALCWEYRGMTPKVCLSYLIDDDPTRGDVRRLCAALGIELKQ